MTADTIVHPTPQTLTITKQHSEQSSSPTTPTIGSTSLKYLTATIESKNIIAPSILRHKQHRHAKNDNHSLLNCKRSGDYVIHSYDNGPPLKKQLQQNWNNQNIHVRDQQTVGDGIMVDEEETTGSTEPLSSKDSLAALSNSSLDREFDIEQNFQEQPLRALQEEQHDYHHNGDVASIFIQAAQQLQLEQQEEQQHQPEQYKDDKNRKEKEEKISQQIVKELIKCSMTIGKISDEIQNRHMEMLCLEKHLILTSFNGAGHDQKKNNHSIKKKRKTKRLKCEEAYKILKQEDNWKRREQILKEQVQHNNDLKSLVKKSKRLVIKLQKQHSSHQF